MRKRVGVLCGGVRILLLYIIFFHLCWVVACIKESSTVWLLQLIKEYLEYDATDKTEKTIRHPCSAKNAAIPLDLDVTVKEICLYLRHHPPIPT